MSIINKAKIASRPVVLLCCAGVVAATLAPVSPAFPSMVNLDAGGTKSCEFSLQLQQSSLVRQQYVAKVVKLVGGSSVAGNAVEQMYGNIQQASYTPGEDGQAPDNPYDLGNVGSKKYLGSAGLDPLSMDCLGCHDGVGASSINTELRNNPYRHGMFVDVNSTDHPIGMEYNRYVNAGRGYKPITDPGGRMIFVNGRVGCLTCHDPLNPEKGHLVMSDSHSALCTTCHNK